MKIMQRLIHKIKQAWAQIRFHLFETDNVLIYWPDFNKGILLLLFALLTVCGHLSWYVINYHSENRIWLSESYHDYRMFTTYCQIALTSLILIISLTFKRFKTFRTFMGWFIPLYFGLLLIYSAHTVGIYSPAAMAGVVNILLIGFVFYQPKVIYSIAVIVAVVLVGIGYLTSIDAISYAPLFSERLNNSEFYKNSFWMNSMLILYIPILMISALFFEILLRQWRRRERKIETLSQIDGLTNVYNRRYSTDYAEHLQYKKKLPYALVILDLDYFKKINDNYGHDIGDEVLRRVAQVLKAHVRGNDIVGRFGGEEFVLILPEQNLADAMEVAERCRQAIEMEQIHLADGTLLKVSASFGVALSDSGKHLEDIAKVADQALYLSKNKGRNTVSHYLEV
ncbi:GGDEF domain-containing protein [Acinetobacter lanii]|uniref:diguanylate cyclase n=1 Tax=Acinetobacter lanii TaxID=2715163 RepID=A0A6G8S621_9GAMM|nr:GGDEF domain-containing protein [Acinetobacter lanii]QIO09597.1 GGDEF domain-containing protein [Acinetobacter lanii]